MKNPPDVSFDWSAVSLWGPGDDTITDAWENEFGFWMLHYDGGGTLLLVNTHGVFYFEGRVAVVSSWAKADVRRQANEALKDPALQDYFKHAAAYAALISD